MIDINTFYTTNDGEVLSNCRNCKVAFFNDSDGCTVGSSLNCTVEGAVTCTANSGYKAVNSADRTTSVLGLSSIIGVIILVFKSIVVNDNGCTLGRRDGFGYVCFLGYSYNWTNRMEEKRGVMCIK